jgi:putative lipoprotein
MSHKQRAILFLAICLGLLVACSPSSSGPSVTGAVTFDGQANVPPESVLVVRIEDVSLADAPAAVIGDQIIPTEGKQFPFPYEVAYDKNQIQENHRYSMSANMQDGAGTLLYISDAAIPVIANGYPTSEVEISVVPVQSSQGERQAAQLTGPKWRLTHLGSAADQSESGITATFGEDGGIKGSAGCNTYSATYELDGKWITIGPVAITEMACDSAIMELEQEYLKALGETAWYAIESDILVFYNVSNSPVLGYEAE